MSASSIIYGNDITHEVNTDGGDVGLSVGIVSESEEETRLSNTRVSDKEELEEVVVSRKAVSAHAAGDTAKLRRKFRHIMY